ncbi:unnamed protein product [Phaedon cochleariae]|uniref:Uncharacterized protein n=1 Tax=Phaedon cochleariae TaxID=80249 RepID=A0A9N9X2R2_PHACE|nr:unnamed protein product [Phaedon cochleariae]
MPLTREQTDELKTIVNVTIKQLWMDQDFLKTIADKVSAEITKNFNDKLKQYDKHLSELTREINVQKNENKKKSDEMGAKLEHLQGENLNLLKKIDFIEQESKKCNLRIYSLAEGDNENTKEVIMAFLNTKMNTNIMPTDIETCHRIGKRTNGKTRGVFLKLKDWHAKNTIFRNKKLLKGTNVVIKEDLTLIRLKLMDEAIGKLDLKSVWTDNGKIIIKRNNQIKTINSSLDLE